MSELKPCPFCGEKENIIVNIPDKEQPLDYAFVECGNCHAGVWRTTQDEFEAVLAWNRRAS